MFDITFLSKELFSLLNCLKQDSQVSKKYIYKKDTLSMSDRQKINHTDDLDYSNRIIYK